MTVFFHWEQSEMALSPNLYIRKQDWRHGIKELIWIVDKVYYVARTTYLFLDDKLEIVIDYNLIFIECRYQWNYLRYYHHPLLEHILLYLKADNLPKWLFRVYIMKLDRMYSWYLFHYIVCYYISKLLLTLCSKRFLSLPCLYWCFLWIIWIFGRLLSKHRWCVKFFLLFLISFIGGIVDEVIAIEVSSDLP